MSEFDHVANTWDTPEKILFFEELSSKIKISLNFQPTDRVLDFGSGTGLFGLNFLTKENQLVAVDTSREMLRVMNSKVNDPTFSLETHLINLEQEDLPLNIGSFDLIVSAMAFHHLEQPEVILKKLTSLLSKSGHLVIVDLDHEDGTFHPDNDKMGVKHFGFSEKVLNQWASNNKLTCEYSIYRYINKNNRKYGQFLAYLQNHQVK